MARITDKKPSRGDPETQVSSVGDALVQAGPPGPDATRAEKKNFAERFSRKLATLIAAALRPDFTGVTPKADGTAQESRARTSKGFKKLDVNYSTPELGSRLGRLREDDQCPRRWLGEVHEELLARR